MKKEYLPPKLKVSVIQLKLKRYDREYNLTTALNAIEKEGKTETKSKIPHIICIPNYFLQTGMEKIPGPVTEALGKIAAGYGVWIIGGTAEDTGEEKGYNSGFLISPDGSVRVIQRKIQMISMEKFKLKGGDKIETFEIEGITMGCVMCNDIFYPEVSRILALKGAEVIFIPSMIGGKGVRGMTAVARARAIENQVYVVNANGIPYEVAEMRPQFIMGGSGIYSLFLENTDLASAGKEDVVIRAELDLKSLREVKNTSELDAFDLCQLSEGKSFNMLKSRRTEVLQLTEMSS